MYVSRCLCQADKTFAAVSYGCCSREAALHIQRGHRRSVLFLQGANCNMHGTAMFQSLAVIFIAQVCSTVCLPSSSLPEGHSATSGKAAGSPEQHGGPVPSAVLRQPRELCLVLLEGTRDRMLRSPACRIIPCMRFCRGVACLALTFLCQGFTSCYIASSHIWPLCSTLDTPLAVHHLTCTCESHLAS